MEFSNNLLPKEAAHYTLQKATIFDGVLHISSGGYARYEIVETDIVNITEYFRVALILDKTANRYTPDIKITLTLATADDNYYNIELYPTYTRKDVFTQEVHLKEGAYKSFVFEISSMQDVNISLWELSPEASDTDVEVVIEGVKQSLPRLLYDVNAYPIIISQPEQTVALITFNLLDATDLQGHLQLSYSSTEECTLTLRFMDGEIPELFSPLTYDIKAGRGSIGVPHAYIERSIGLHSIMVSAQVTSGQLTIGTRDVLFTIDGGYLAERIVDIGSQVQDITVRQISEELGPDEIWLVGLEAEEALVRKRKYDERSLATYEPVMSLGYAREAAIEFDGEWTLAPDRVSYTIRTQEWPWIFWIDRDGLLKAVQSDSLDEAISLVPNISDISHLCACRGYSSSVFPEQDQGLIVSYISDGNVYYMHLVYDVDTGTKLWKGPFPIFQEGTAEHIHVHRLNDYRMAWCITTTESNLWYITERTYISQAVVPEIIESSIVQLNRAIGVSENGPPELLHDIQLVDNSVIITFNYELHCETDLSNVFTYSTGFDATLTDIKLDGKVITFTFDGTPPQGFVITPNHFLFQYHVPGMGDYIVPNTPWKRAFIASAQEYLQPQLSHIDTTIVIRGTQKLSNKTTETFVVDVSGVQSSTTISKVQQLVATPPDEVFIGGVQNASADIVISYVGTSPI